MKPIFKTQLFKEETKATNTQWDKNSPKNPFSNFISKLRLECWTQIVGSTGFGKDRQERKMESEVKAQAFI